MTNSKVEPFSGKARQCKLIAVCKEVQRDPKYLVTTEAERDRSVCVGLLVVFWEKQMRIYFFFYFV